MTSKMKPPSSPAPQISPPGPLIIQPSLLANNTTSSSLRIPSIVLSNPSSLGLLAPQADEEVTNDLNGSNNNNGGIDIIDMKPSGSNSRPNHHNSGHSMDMNMYATRKTIAQGIMDLGLMCANASQLKYVLINANHHRYFQVTVSLIVISILMQIIVGIMFIGLGRLNINYGQDRRRADMMNNASVIVIFLVTVINVLITAFGPSENVSQSSGPYGSIYHPGSMSQGSVGSAKLTSWTNLYPDSGSGNQ